VFLPRFYFMSVHEDGEREGGGRERDKRKCGKWINYTIIIRLACIHHDTDTTSINNWISFLPSPCPSVVGRCLSRRRYRWAAAAAVLHELRRRIAEITAPCTERVAIDRVFLSPRPRLLPCMRRDHAARGGAQPAGAVGFDKPLCTCTDSCSIYNFCSCFRFVAQVWDNGIGLYSYLESPLWWLRTHGWNVRRLIRCSCTDVWQFEARQRKLLYDHESAFEHSLDRRRSAHHAPWCTSVVIVVGHAPREEG